MHTLYRSLLCLTLFLTSNFQGYSQNLPANISDKQIQELVSQMEARGMSEAEMEAYAKARGYTTADISYIKERIQQLKTGVTVKSEINNNTVAREQVGEVSKRSDEEVLEETTKGKRIFGKDIFNKKNLTFEPNLQVATPPDYILGVNDELSVDISGYAVGTYKLKVSSEGTIRLENLAPIYVNGLTVLQAKEKIKQKLSSLYSGLHNGTLQMDLTLTKVKTINVTLIGQVENPGTYSLSSLSTLFNALYVSGGPASNGSFRNIQLLRNNKVVHQIDIYDFLTTGSLKDNVNLRDRDVIFVPIVGTMVEFDGEVKRPYRFELKGDESLNDALRFAGGFNSNAYTAQLSVERFTNKEKEILSIKEGELNHFLLKNGDKISVGAILDRYSNRVEVTGAVFRPGTYALGKDINTVGDLIRTAEGLREDAFKNRALIKRLNKQLDAEMISINLDSVLHGYDIPLQREDVLIIKSITELRELRKVNIAGNVIIPGEYDYLENMTLNDLIVLAGGLKQGGSSQRIEVSRRVLNPENDNSVEIFTVDIDPNLNKNSKEFILSPFDIVVVRELPNYDVQKLVSVVGEINYPGAYAISSKIERISDLIDRAGGAKTDAYLRGAQFYRGGRQVAVNIEEVLQNKHKSINLFLEEGDRLVIPKEQQTIKISGEVLNPTSVAYQENLKFRDYITQAGGFTDSAFVRKIYVRYPNGHVDKTRSFLTAKIFPKVEKGMEVIVPTKSRQRLSKAEIISLSTGVVSLSAVLVTLLRIL